MSTPTKFRPSPMMPLGKPTQTNACSKTLASTDTDSQKTGDCRSPRSHQPQQKARHRRQLTYLVAVCSRTRKIESNHLILKNNSKLTRGWVSGDPVLRSSQMGAKPASKAWPEAWQPRDAANCWVMIDPPLISP